MKFSSPRMLTAEREPTENMTISSTPFRSRRPRVANPDVMCRSMNICLAADICEQLKRNLKFDLRQAEFISDPEANRLRSRAMRAPYMG